MSRSPDDPRPVERSLSPPVPARPTFNAIGPANDNQDPFDEGEMTFSGAVAAWALLLALMIVGGLLDWSIRP